MASKRPPALSLREAREGQARAPISRQASAVAELFGSASVNSPLTRSKSGEASSPMQRGAAGGDFALPARPGERSMSPLTKTSPAAPLPLLPPSVLMHSEIPASIESPASTPLSPSKRTFRQMRRSSSGDAGALAGSPEDLESARSSDEEPSKLRRSSSQASPRVVKVRALAVG
ncbi:MAG: hypothetical protein SGPRY_013103 [Prymnesium sp.]